METTYYRAAVGAFIVNEKQQLLITLVESHQAWKFITGGLEPGESSETALIRELQEELGNIQFKILKKSKISHIYHLPKEYIDKFNLAYIGQAETYYWVYIPSSTQFELTESELDDYMWIDISEEQISKYFGKHDENNVYSSLVPTEFKNEHIAGLIPNH